MPATKRALSNMDPNEQPPTKRVDEGDKSRRERIDVKEQFSQRAFDGRYEYICVSRPPWGVERDEDDDEEEEQEVDEESKAVWLKPASEHPEWKWVMMRESHDMLREWSRLADCCDPDNFGMYIYNDFHGYGLVEILEDAIKAFHKEVTPSKEPYNFHQMWAIVSTLAQFLNNGLCDPAFHVDDGEKINKMVQVIGGMFLTALNEIDRIGQLTSESQFRDLGHVMALYFRWEGEGLTTELGDEDDTDWQETIFAYAKKAGIELSEQGVAGLEDDLNNLDELEPLDGKAKVDRWNWKNMFKGFKEVHMGNTFVHGLAGGKCFNIMEWTREERAEAAFDKKDPLEDFTDEQIASGELAMN